MQDYPDGPKPAALSESDLSTLVNYQTSLFTALVGVLSAKGLMTQGEVGAALGIVAAQEADARAKSLLTVLSRALLSQEPYTLDGEAPPLSVIRGGRVD